MDIVKNANFLGLAADGFENSMYFYIKVHIKVHFKKTLYPKTGSTVYLIGLALGLYRLETRAKLSVQNN